MPAHTNPPYALNVHHLRKSFNSLIAVDDISFKIHPKEIIGILGPNGAGKTTTIRLITGVYPLENPGSIEVFQSDMKKSPLRCKAQFGIVPELTNAFLDFTVIQNITFSGKIYGLNKQEIANRAESLLHQFNLYEKKNAITKSLSKGLKQRLNFCLALIHDPPILILDEPTSGLDPMSIKILRDQILYLRSQGKTILLTTHDMLEAEKICDRVMIINHGKIIVDESPDSLRKRFGNKKKIIFQVESEGFNQICSILNSEFMGTLVQILKPGVIQISSLQPLTDIAKLNQIAEKFSIEILEMKLEEVTLEDIFIQIIQKGENSCQTNQ